VKNAEVAGNLAWSAAEKYSILQESRSYAAAFLRLGIERSRCRGVRGEVA
jgi:hypothetical protein